MSLEVGFEASKSHAGPRTPTTTDQDVSSQLLLQCHACHHALHHDDNRLTLPLKL